MRFWQAAEQGGEFRLRGVAEDPRSQRAWLRPFERQAVSMKMWPGSSYEAVAPAGGWVQLEADAALSMGFKMFDAAPVTEPSQWRLLSALPPALEMGYTCQQVFVADGGILPQNAAMRLRPCYAPDDLDTTHGFGLVYDEWLWFGPENQEGRFLYQGWPLVFAGESVKWTPCGCALEAPIDIVSFYQPTGLPGNGVLHDAWSYTPCQCIKLYSQWVKIGPELSVIAESTMSPLELQYLNVKVQIGNFTPEIADKHMLTVHLERTYYATDEEKSRKLYEFWFPDATREGVFGWKLDRTNYVAKVFDGRMGAGSIPAPAELGIDFYPESEERRRLPEIPTHHFIPPGEYRVVARLVERNNMTNVKYEESRTVKVPQLVYLSFRPSSIKELIKDEWKPLYLAMGFQMSKAEANNIVNQVHQRVNRYFNPEQGEQWTHVRILRDDMARANMNYKHIQITAESDVDIDQEGLGWSEYGLYNLEPGGKGHIVISRILESCRDWQEFYNINKWNPNYPEMRMMTKEDFINFTTLCITHEIGHTLGLVAPTTPKSIESPAPAGTYLHDRSPTAAEGGHYIYDELLKFHSNPLVFNRYIMNDGKMTANAVKAGMYGANIWSPYDVSYLSFILPSP